jgi:threonine dehydrogenase-like Zn-dependent dehydrogenase
MDPGEVVDGAVDVVLECSGRRTAVESALGQLRRAGSLVLVGTGLEPPAFDINRILVNELHITGALEYDHDGFRQSLELLETGRLPTDLILHGVDTALPDMVETMQDLQAGQIPGKVLVCPALETDDSPTQQH